MESEKLFRLEKARQAINLIYLDGTTEPEEILESLESLADDIEMYAFQIEKTMLSEEGENAEEPSGG